MKRKQAQSLVICLVVAWLLPLSSWAQEEDAGTARSYPIGPRDRLQIRVDELPDLNSEQVVAEDGTVTLPIIGTVEASGLSENSFAMRLRKKLEDEGLRRPTVAVKVVEYRSRPVSLLGAIIDPGNHFVPGRTTLMEVILNAGGLRPDHGEYVLVRRRASNGLSGQVRIPIDELLDIGNPDFNIPILAGDHINVPAAREITIHFLGEVASAGSQTFKSNQRVTLLTALARAGGLLETASKKIRIIRQSADGERQENIVDYRSVLSGSTADPKLQDGDLIVVKESFF